MKAVFVDVRFAEEQEEALKTSSGSNLEKRIHVVDTAQLADVPRSPFCYWVPDEIRSTFSGFEPMKEPTRQAWSGATTMDDFRHVRAWFELPGVATRDDWPTFSKGGKFQRFYLPLDLCVDWRDGGAEMKARISYLRESRGHGHQWTAVLNGYKMYLKPGLYWSRRSLKGMSARVLPAGSIFSDKSPTLISDSEAELLPLLAIINSSSFRYLVSMQMSFGSYEVGVINRTPVPPLGPDDAVALGALAREGWDLQMGLDSTIETSSAFVLPALLQMDGLGFVDRMQAWSDRVALTARRLEEVQAGIDGAAFELYGISSAGQREVSGGFVAVGEETLEATEDEEEEDAGHVTADGVLEAEQLVSWAVGVSVGRFDVRLAADRASWPVAADPFAALDVCSPGMLSSSNGHPAVVPPEGYPVDVSPILVDDPGHSLDLSAHVRSVFDIVFGDEAEAWWNEIGRALGAKGDEIASWLRRGFFDRHLKAYSRSRRKAPVLWPLGTRSGSYVVWLYGHRVSDDTLFQVVNDIVAPKVAIEEQQLLILRQEAGSDPTASQRRAIDAQDRFVDELREFRRSIEEVAPLWAPNLNDGVVVVLAPLWRLFQHNKAWSKELQKHWKKLESGEYDWAQLAMRLWPERVVPKCRDDRSLAISHGLSAVFWEKQSGSDKWDRRPRPTIAVEDLVAEREVVAVQSALNLQVKS